MKYIRLKNLDITIDKGDLISIIGPNGSGKTILLRMISGRVKNDYFFIDNNNVNNLSLEFKRNNIVCVFNDNLFKTDYVLDELKYYLEILKVNDVEERINEFINYFRLNNILNVSLNNLDLENKVYIKLLSLLIIKPSIFCVDDLFCYLNKDKFVKILNYIKERNITLLSVVSNMEDLFYYDKVLVINKGKKEMFDNINNVLKNENLFNSLGLKLPFIYNINNLLKSYELIEKELLSEKDLVKLLWK